MMYYKPYQGKMYNTKFPDGKLKCFMDECEWRYVPDVTILDCEQIIINDGKKEFRDLSNALSGRSEISLQFEYSDLKYIILAERKDIYELVQMMKKAQLSQQTQIELLSKVLIWNEAKGDF